jgi:uncharacterized protein (DUF488 family)
LRIEAVLATLYTVGHSTRSLDDLIETLHAHQIQTLVDIRAFPMSRRLPQFNRESLETSLPAAGIRYVWMKALGGYRKNADYMLTSEFENAMAELVALAESSRTAYMCAERVYFRCHRMLVSDWLVAHGHEVVHIDGTGPVKPHRLTSEGRIVNGELIYRGDRLL